MGALPEHESPVGAQRRSPEMAPPLRAVPRREQSPPETGGAGPRSAPPPPEAPVAEPVAPDADQTGQQAPDRGQQAASSGECPEEGGGLDLDRIAALRAWAGEHLLPPDVWNAPAPPLKQLWAQTLAARHLPSAPVVQVAERVRVAISLPLVGGLCLLAWCLTSAARTAAALVVAGALWVLVSTLVAAAAELF